MDYRDLVLADLADDNADHEDQAAFALAEAATYRGLFLQTLTELGLAIRRNDRQREQLAQLLRGTEPVGR